MNDVEAFQMTADIYYHDKEWPKWLSDMRLRMFPDYLLEVFLDVPNQGTVHIPVNHWVVRDSAGKISVCEIREEKT